MGFHQPGVHGPGPTMVGGRAVGSTPRFSEQQQRILRALCKPLFADGDGFNPSSDLEVSDGDRDRRRCRHAGAGSARAPVRPGRHAAARTPRRGRAAGRALRPGRGGRGRHAGLTCAPYAGVRGGEERTTGSCAVCATTSRPVTWARATSSSSVAWSSVNYKDALATIAEGQGGADLAARARRRPGRRAGRRRAGDAGWHSRDRPRVRPRRVVSWWIRSIRAGPGGLVVPLPHGMGERGDGRRNRRLHGGDVDRARGVRGQADAGRCWSPAPPAGSGEGGRHAGRPRARGRSQAGKGPEWLRALGGTAVIARAELAGEPARPLEMTRSGQARSTASAASSLTG